MVGIRSESGTGKRKRWRFLSLLVVIAAVAPTGTAHAAETPAGDWTFGPTVEKSAPNSRIYFDYNLLPGQTFDDSATLKNDTGQQQTWDLYPADAINLPNGGAFSLLGRNQPKQGVGAWISLPADNVTVPAHRSAIVPFRINMPADVTPGDHAGGVVALLRTSPGQTPQGQAVQSRPGIGGRVYIRVPGALHAGLEVTDARVVNKSVGALGSGHATLSFTVVNTGNVRLDSVATVHADGLFGWTVKRFPSTKLPALLPGARVVISQPWNHLPLIGRFTARIDVKAQGAEAKGSTVVWVLPWLLILILVALIVGAVIVYRRRRRQPPSPEPIPDRELEPVG